jgi:inorganic pyrophosphatase
MTSYLDLPIGDGAPELITALIEIPQGGINKYEYDKKLHESFRPRTTAIGRSTLRL